MLTYLEKINPSYLDLLLPLSKWKILDVKSLREESEYEGSASGFYKIISKLEKNSLIDSFINSWNNQKFVYLLPDGMKALGRDNNSLHINREVRFHDSLVSKVARTILQLPFSKQVFLDFEIKQKFPLLERLPDFLIEGELKRPFKMAVEIELTAKSKDRVGEIFRSYSNSKVVNNILYITDKMSIIKSYRKHLEELGNSVSKEKFLFLFDKHLSKTGAGITKAPIFHLENKTSLNEVFCITNG